MDGKDTQQPEPNEVPAINFFRPIPGYMRRRVRLIWAMLGAWALLTFGFQLLLHLTQSTPEGAGPLTQKALFGFPLHFLFTGQLLILCFIALCYLSNSFMDRLTRKYTKRR